MKKLRWKEFIISMIEFIRDDLELETTKNKKDQIISLQDLGNQQEILFRVF